MTVVTRMHTDQTRCKTNGIMKANTHNSIAKVGAPALAALVVSLSLTQSAQAAGWADTGSLNTKREYHTATLLANGKVLVVGGRVTFSADGLSTSELYDPATGAWTATGTLSTTRDSHTATLLPNGKVLVAGGFTGAAGSRSPLSSAELYDPATG